MFSCSDREALRDTPQPRSSNYQCSGLKEISTERNGVITEKKKKIEEARYQFAIRIKFLTVCLRLVWL